MKSFLVKKQILKIFNSSDHDKAIKEKQIIPENVIVDVYNYADDNEEMHKLNYLYDKKNKNKNMPTIIDIHGGGWVYGNKGLNSFYMSYFAQEGFNAIVPSFRLCGHKYYYKDMMQDVFKMLNWIRANHKKLNIDLNNLFLTGDSSGGQMVLFIDTINKNEFLQKIYGVPHVDLSFNAICATHPACMLNDMHIAKDHKFIDKMFIDTYFGILFKDKKNITAKYASFDDYFKYSKLPPLFIVSSLGDTYLNPNAIALHEFLEKNNFKHEYLMVQNKNLNHVFNVLFADSKEGIDTNSKIVSFFKKFIK